MCEEQDSMVRMEGERGRFSSRELNGVLQRCGERRYGVPKQNSGKAGPWMGSYRCAPKTFRVRPHHKQTSAAIVDIDFSTDQGIVLDLDVQVV